MLFFAFFAILSNANGYRKKINFFFHANSRAKKNIKTKQKNVDKNKQVPKLKVLSRI